jgi:hypothetical protein
LFADLGAAHCLHSVIADGGVALFPRHAEVKKVSEFPQRLRGYTLFRRLAHVFGRRRPAFSDPYLAWLATAMAEDHGHGEEAHRP